VAGATPDPFADAGFATRAIHAGQPADPGTGAVVPPISLATTFAQHAVGEHAGFEYGRTGNPTRAALEACLASLEGAARGLAFASGMAAEDAVLRALAGPGDHVVIPNDAYGGTFRLVARVLAAAGVSWSAADLTRPEALARDWPEGTTVVWVETPTNPTLTIVDIRAVAEVAHARGARVVVDNTFATPYLQQPLALGADLVVHSTTKYLGGHSDVVGGFVGTADPAVGDQVAFLQNAVGAVPSPFDCYLVLRGIKTLAVRMDRHGANAAEVAAMLGAHPAVDRVLYPGRPDHPGHAVACRQMRGFGGMVSFTLVGGEAAALATVARTRVFTLAESLGAVESLIEHPARMTHASAADSPLAVDPGLIRLSVGIEAVEDLLADLDHALGVAPA
jgi:cystathionine gamma-synthase